ATGGFAGLVLSVWATKLLSVLVYSGVGMPADFPKFDLSPDGRVLGTLLLLSAVATLVFALGPAWKLARLDVNSDLKDGRSLGGRRASLAARELLATVQLSFSLALLVAAALFSRSAMNVIEADPGFEFGSNFYISVDPALAGYPGARVRQVLRQGVDRLRSLPGVESVSAATSIPFGNSWDLAGVQVGGVPPTSNQAATFSAGKELFAIQNLVGPDYFRTIGVPLLRGREFDRREIFDEHGPRVAIISQSLAEQFWPGENPVGRSIQFPGTQPNLMTVVGVAPEVSWQVFEKRKRPQLYLPFSGDFARGFNIHVRVVPGYSATQLMGAARQALVQLDDRIPLTGLKTLAALHRDSPIVRVTKLGSALFGGFGGLALVLS
ncbi:MAG: ABC transporter permease, partial [Limisphaerales bacterium]